MTETEYDRQARARKMAISLMTDRGYDSALDYIESMISSVESKQNHNFWILVRDEITGCKNPKAAPVPKYNTIAGQTSLDGVL